MKKLSWKPKRYGAIFCAPACGGGCTKEQYNAAAKLGKALAARLGDGWAFKLWENFGWHVEVVSKCGRITVTPHVTGGKVIDYSATLGEPGSAGGRYWGHGKTPESAIKKMTALARHDLAKLGAVLTGL